MDEKLTIAAAIEKLKQKVSGADLPAGLQDKLTIFLRNWRSMPIPNPLFGPITSPILNISTGLSPCLGIPAAKIF